MRTRKNQGVALVAMAVWILALIGFLVLAVDVPRLAFTASEVQSVADAGALAGALALVEGKDPYTDAQVVAGVNKADGHAASFAPSDIVVGNYASGTFVPNGNPQNAVRANEPATILNIVPALSQNPHSTIARHSTAAFQTLGSGRPGIPIALGNCFVCNSATDCSTGSITLTFGSTSNNAGWILNDGGGSGGIGDYTPSGCGGGGVTNPILGAGQSISIDNGVKTSTCTDYECLIGNSYLVPVVGTSCGTPFNGSTVVGFATVKILAVSCHGGQKYMTMQPEFVNCTDPQYQAVCAGSSIGGSCPSCGTGRVVLVN